MKVLPIRTDRVEVNPSEKIEQWIVKSIEHAGDEVRDGDILVLSSKIVSYFEKNVLRLSDIVPTEDAVLISQRMNANPELVQLSMDQADEFIAETPWVLLTMKNGVYTANSGVDLSNVPEGYAVVWPNDPFASAAKIRKEIMRSNNLSKLAVLIVDSACTPGRKGTIALAIGYAGIAGYQELKGEKDLFDNLLRYSALNRVDSLATAANLEMGESTESAPISIIREYSWQQVVDTKNDEMIISPSDEMFPMQ